MVCLAYRQRDTKLYVFTQVDITKRCFFNFALYFLANETSNHWHIKPTKFHALNCLISISKTFNDNFNATDLILREGERERKRERDRERERERQREREREREREEGVERWGKRIGI